VSLGRVPEVPPETRPIGSLLNADPSSKPFAQSIHHSEVLERTGPARKGAMFGSEGIATVDKTMLRYYDPKRREEEE
jgi:hypothetical protein